MSTSGELASRTTVGAEPAGEPRPPGALGNFAGYGNFATAGDLGMSVILHVTLSAAGRFEGASIHPIQFTGSGRPVPGGGAIAFVARLSMEDFGPSGARILASGVIKAPDAYRP